MWSLERVSDLHQKKEKENALLAAQVHSWDIARKKGKEKNKESDTLHHTNEMQDGVLDSNTHTHTPIATSRIVYSIL